MSETDLRRCLTLIRGEHRPAEVTVTIDGEVLEATEWMPDLIDAWTRVDLLYECGVPRSDREIELEEQVSDLAAFANPLLRHFESEPDGEEMTISIPGPEATELCLLAAALELTRAEWST